MRTVLFLSLVMLACDSAGVASDDLPGDPESGQELFASIEARPRGFGAADHDWMSDLTGTSSSHAIEGTSRSRWHLHLTFASEGTPATVACGDRRTFVRLMEEPPGFDTADYVAEKCSITVTKSGTKAGEVVEGTFTAQLVTSDVRRPARPLAVRDGFFRATIKKDRPPPREPY